MFGLENNNNNNNPLLRTADGTERVVQRVDHQEWNSEAVKVAARGPILQIGINIFIPKHRQHHSLSNVVEICGLEGGGEEESKLIEGGGEEESKLIEGGGEEESKLIEGGGEEESKLIEWGGEEESKLIEWGGEEESKLIEWGGEEESINKRGRGRGIKRIKNWTTRAIHHL